MSQSWHWPASGWNQGSEGPEAGAGLLKSGLGPPDMTGFGASVVLGLVYPCQYVGSGPGGSKGPLIRGARSGVSG